MQANGPEDGVDQRVRRRLRELHAARPDAGGRRHRGAHRRLDAESTGIGEALSVSTDELLRGPDAEDPRVRGGSHTQRGITFWPLTRHGPAGGLHAFKIRISARRRKPPVQLPVHEGQDWMYVLSGSIRLILGERDFVIKPGEAVEFSTWTPHWFGAADGPAEAIMIFGVHGERLHLHE